MSCNILLFYMDILFGRGVRFLGGPVCLCRFVYSI